MRRRQENNITVSVSGWGLDDDHLKALGQTIKKEVFWNVNFLIPVNIPSSGVSGKNLLISQAELKADQTAMTCDLTLVNKERYL